MKLNLLSQNSKIKKSFLADGREAVVFNFGIPAFKSQSGEFTCPNASACATGCYARSGAYLFSNVAKKFESRFEATKLDSFGAEIQKDLDSIKKKYLGKAKIFIRIHDSGDFYSPEYLAKWIKIMLVNADLNFYAYTKMISLFKKSSGVNSVKNFSYIFSFGGREDHLIKSTDRHSMVFSSTSDLEKHSYADTSSNDLIALGENKKIGLVFHHAKNFDNTTWGQILEKQKNNGGILF